MNADQIQPILDDIHMLYGGKGVGSSSKNNYSDLEQDYDEPTPNDLLLIDKISRSKHGEQFEKLMAGEWGDLDYPSQSEAEMGFCSILAFWCPNDHRQIDRIYRSSGLCREKWDDGRGDQTYGQMTIGKAIVNRQESLGGNLENEFADLLNTQKTEDDLVSIDPMDIFRCINQKPPPKTYLISNLIPTGAIGIMNGQGGTGKSNLSLYFAAMIAAGYSEGVLKVSKPRRVIVINVEDSEEDIWRRLHALAQVYPFIKNHIDLIKQNLIIIAGRGKVGPLMCLKGQNPYPTEYERWLGGLIQNANPDLLIIDTKSRLYGLDENNNSHAAIWLSLFERFQIQNPECSFLILHHNSKISAESADQTSSRGASALIDNARFNLVLKHMNRKEAEKYGVDHRNYFTLHNAKANYSPRQDTIIFRRMDEGIPKMVDLGSELVHSAVNRLVQLLSEDHDGSMNKRELIDRAGGSEIRSLLREEFGITKAKLPEIIECGIDNMMLERVTDDQSSIPKPPILIRVVRSEIPDG